MSLRISYLIDNGSQPAILHNVKFLTIFNKSLHVTFTDDTEDMCLTNVLGIIPYYLNEG